MIERNKFDESLNKLGNIANAYSLNNYSEKISSLAKQLVDFDIKVLFVGHYSAGKSALLNLLINRGEILTEDQSPQTALPAELNWSEKEELQVYYNDGSVRKLKICQPMIDDKIHHYKYLINSPYLKELSDFTIVDTPGFDAGIENHNKALSSYIGFGSCFILVINIEKGTIDTETLSFINELLKYSDKTVIALNKTDKLLPENIEIITEQVRESLAINGIDAPIIKLSKYPD